MPETQLDEVERSGGHVCGAMPAHDGANVVTTSMNAKNEYTTNAARMM
jgi:hypothetical protein